MPVIEWVSKQGLKLRCNACGYERVYFGTSQYKATCSSCSSTVRFGYIRKSNLAIIERPQSPQVTRPLETEVNARMELTHGVDE
jgi:hypothetical protein